MPQRQPRTHRPTDSVITRIRLAVGETQDEFAARLGVSKRSIVRWEREEKLPDTEAILRSLRLLAKQHDITFK